MFEEKNNEITVNLEKSIEGEYAFELDNIPGRTFSVLYSTGDTYYGPEEAASASEPDGDWYHKVYLYSLLKERTCYEKY